MTPAESLAKHRNFGLNSWITWVKTWPQSSHAVDFILANFTPSFINPHSSCSCAWNKLPWSYDQQWRFSVFISFPFAPSLLFSLAEVQTHRLVMVLFPSTVRQNFCFSHLGGICRALWMAKNGHETPRSPEHALNYLLLLKCVFYLEKWGKNAGNKEFEGGCLFFIWQNDSGFWGILNPSIVKHWDTFPSTAEKNADTSQSRLTALVWNLLHQQMNYTEAWVFK